MTSHDLVVPDESQGWQAFGEGISHHFVRALRHEFEEAIQYKFTHIVLTSVNMTGEFRRTGFSLFATQARLSLYRRVALV